jgi:hypothetical protein
MVEGLVTSKECGCFSAAFVVGQVTERFSLSIGLRAEKMLNGLSTVAADTLLQVMGVSLQLLLFGAPLSLSGGIAVFTVRVLARLGWWGLGVSLEKAR